MTTPVDFFGEVDGVASLTAMAMFLPGAGGPNFGNWSINANPNGVGRILRHSTTNLGVFTIAELSGLRDALNQGVYGTSACKYPPYWELLTDTADGTDLLHSANQGSTYSTLLAGMQSDRESLKVFLNSLGLP